MSQHAALNDSYHHRLMRFPLFLFLVTFWLTDLALGQWTLIDAGSSWTFNGTTGAASNVWRINGEAVLTDPKPPRSFLRLRITNP